MTLRQFLARLRDLGLNPAQLSEEIEATSGRGSSVVITNRYSLAQKK